MIAGELVIWMQPRLHYTDYFLTASLKINLNRDQQGFCDLNLRTNPSVTKLWGAR